MALRARIRAETREILDRAGATVIFVTHDQEEALSLADRVAVMRGGQIVQVGKPEELYRNPTTRKWQNSLPAQTSSPPTSTTVTRNVR